MIALVSEDQTTAACGRCSVLGDVEKGRERIKEVGGRSLQPQVPLYLADRPEHRHLLGQSIDSPHSLLELALEQCGIYTTFGQTVIERRVAR